MNGTKQTDDVAETVTLTDGRAVSLSHLTRPIKDDFGTWMASTILAKVRAQKRLVMAPIEARKADLNGEEYKQLRAEATAECEAVFDRACDRVAAGAYSWGSMAVQEALNDGAGLIQITYLLMQRNQPGITLDEAEKIALDSPKLIGQAVAKICKADREG